MSFWAADRWPQILIDFQVEKQKIDGLLVAVSSVLGSFPAGFPWCIPRIFPFPRDSGFISAILVLFRFHIPLAINWTLQESATGRCLALPFTFFPETFVVKFYKLQRNFFFSTISVKSNSQLNYLSASCQSCRSNHLKFSFIDLVSL